LIILVANAEITTEFIMDYLDPW